MTLKPSKYNNRLDEHLIDTVAQILYKARLKCLDNFDSDNGDTAWSNGVRSREWCCKAIREAAEEYDFLEILVDKGRSFCFLLNGVPVKFFKDNSQKPSSKLFKYREIEQKQYDLFPADGVSIPKDILWRFVIETDITLDVSKIVFMGLNKITNDIECFYETPIRKDDVRLLASLSTMKNDIEEALDEIEISYKSVAEKKEAIND